MKMLFRSAVIAILAATGAVAAEVPPLMGMWGAGDALLVGVESRTSSPLRIPRDPETLESPDLLGLYPAGEGGGYAGGIVSAALDGLRVARAICAQLAR